MTNERVMHGNTDETRILVAFALFLGVDQFEKTRR